MVTKVFGHPKYSILEPLWDRVKVTVRLTFKRAFIKFTYLLRIIPRSPIEMLWFQCYYQQETGVLEAIWFIWSLIMPMSEVSPSRKQLYKNRSYLDPVWGINSVHISMFAFLCYVWKILACRLTWSRVLIVQCSTCCSNKISWQTAPLHQPTLYPWTGPGAPALAWAKCGEDCIHFIAKCPYKVSLIALNSTKNDSYQ